MWKGRKEAKKMDRECLFTVYNTENLLNAYLLILFGIRNY